MHDREPSRGWRVPCACPERATRTRPGYLKRACGHSPDSDTLVTLTPERVAGSETTFCPLLADVADSVAPSGRVAVRGGDACSPIEVRELTDDRRAH